VFFLDSEPIQADRVSGLACSMAPSPASLALPDYSARSNVFGRNYLSGVVAVIMAWVCMAGWAAASPAYPLKTVAGQHYVVDQNGSPFFIQGDSPWFLTEALNASNVDYYLSNKCALGYNSIILDIAAQPVDDELNEATNYYGQFPFTNTVNGYTNLLSWNVNYFTNVDWVIQRAGFYGMCVFAYPLYDGYGGAGWYAQMAGNPVTNLYQYGAFIGNRYKNFSNIVWIGAGDYNEPNAPGNCLWNNVAAGIASADANHLITAQPARPTSTTYYNAFVDYQATYPTWYVYEQSLLNYQITPVLACFLREPYYENNTGHITGPSGANVTALNCRQFGYWGVLSGDMGQFYGDEKQWPFTSGWQNEMFDAASTTMPHLGQLLTNRLWYNFVPDANHTVVTSGYGTSGAIDYITTARESHGYTVVSYFPQDEMTATVAMSNIAGTTANAWWYNPSNGVASFIAAYATTGTQNFTPASTSDWVLVLDDAAQNYPPPGLSSAASPEALQITPSAGFSSSGPFRGPFSVTNQNFTLTNTGTTSLNWSLANTSAWLSASSSSGTLTSGGAAAIVSIFLNAAADNLTVGSHTNTLWFTNLNDSRAQSFQFNLTVSTASTTLTWDNPAGIPYGTALTSNQLNATASVPGSFVYSPNNGAILNTGPHTLFVTFTPTDTTDYSSAGASVNLVVAPAALSVTASNASRAYALTNPVFGGTIAGLENGDSIAATYNCSAGSNSTVGPYAIVPTLVDPGDRQTNYTLSLVNGTLTITQAVPLMIWSNPPAITYGTALTSNQLNAKANTGGNFVYSPTNGTVLNAGTNALSVTFNPSDAVDYRSVTDSVSLLVMLMPIALNIQMASNAIVLRWTDPASHFVLQGAPALNGVFTNVPGGSSPYSNTVSQTKQFFRLVAP